MAKIVKSVLRDELNRLKSLEKLYLKNIQESPKGYLLTRQRGLKKYYYLSYREEAKIKQEYLGALSKEKLEELNQKIKSKKQRRQQLKEVRTDIKYLEGLLKK